MTNVGIRKIQKQSAFLPKPNIKSPTAAALPPGYEYLLHPIIAVDTNVALYSRYLTPTCEVFRSSVCFCNFVCFTTGGHESSNYVLVRKYYVYQGCT